MEEEIEKLVVARYVNEQTSPTSSNVKLWPRYTLGVNKLLHLIPISESSELCCQSIIWSLDMWCMV